MSGVTRHPRLPQRPAPPPPVRSWPYLLALVLIVAAVSGVCVALSGAVFY